MLEDIARYVKQLPNTLFDKIDVIPNNCYVNITIDNIARPDGWSTHDIALSQPQLENMQQGNLNGMMTSDQSNAVSNAINNAINHVSARQHFRSQISKSADNSPSLQPQGKPPAINEDKPLEIIPVISVSQLPINQTDDVGPDDYVDENKILPKLEHDRIEILFRKLSMRLQSYFTNNYNEMAIHFMNYDHRQIIAALNDELVLRELGQNINAELEIYNKKPLKMRMETSIWTNKLSRFDIKELVAVKKNNTRI